MAKRRLVVDRTKARELRDKLRGNTPNEETPKDELQAIRKERKLQRLENSKNEHISKRDVLRGNYTPKRKKMIFTWEPGTLVTIPPRLYERYQYQIQNLGLTAGATAVVVEASEEISRRYKKDVEGEKVYVSGPQGIQTWSSNWIKRVDMESLFDAEEE